ncbi:MAG: B12-binding domain-containing radical SAM protein [Hespellia sp.]|nr:B12-binding domain-containing radical SAM protein [Hespellia sp.]
MKILLTAINAKYIHSNLAVYCLKAYAKKYDSDITIAEYTINQQVDDILMSIYKEHPDVLMFSCYLWNITYVEAVVTEIKKILPDTEIWLGGPEVSFDAEDVLGRLPQVKGVMKGEGEETFLELMEYYHQKDRELSAIAGITYYGDRIYNNPWRSVMELSKVPFVYHHMEDFQNKIIYYETSRGCPFSCSYCLSSIDKQLRFRDLELVKEELQFFIDQEVPQVKFVDRTFNCRHEHAMTIWKYIVEHDKGITNFHFEVAADLLKEEELLLMETMRPGLIQLEIGIQSTNPETICEIRRTMKFEEVKRIVLQINSGHNIHQHLDLIAGLPLEDYKSFHHSFNDVYALRPNQLQLGFLKVLKGSYMGERVKDYELIYQTRPPFEVLATKWMSYDEIMRLKGVEDMVEVYYNSGQFQHTMEFLETFFADAFTMYETLADYYEENGLRQVNHTRIARYEILLTFAAQYKVDTKHIGELLIYDLYLRENVKNRPAFAGEMTVSKEESRMFYEQEARERSYLAGYEQYDKNQLRKMTHLERIEGKLLLFDYQNRSPLNHQAKVVEVQRLSLSREHRRWEQ